MSFVLMWPSTLMQWNDSSTASTRAAWASCFRRHASVITSESIVAMFGPIIAAPLAMPVIRVGMPPIVTSRPRSLGTVSVVMMPRAAFSSDRSSSPSCLAAAWMPA